MILENLLDCGVTTAKSNKLLKNYTQLSFSLSLPRRGALTTHHHPVRRPVEHAFIRVRMLWRPSFVAISGAANMAGIAGNPSRHTRSSTGWSVHCAEIAFQSRHSLRRLIPRAWWHMTGDCLRVAPAAARIRILLVWVIHQSPRVTPGDIMVARLILLPSMICQPFIILLCGTPAQSLVSSHNLGADPVNNSIEKTLQRAY